MVNFEWYRSFIAVYRSGTVTYAAQSRCLTQPAISQHIAALEVSLGSPLFQRTRKKMVPTDSAKALYSQMATSIDNLETMSMSLGEGSVIEMPLIRLGSPLDYFYEVGLERLIDAQCRLRVEIGDTHKIIDGLSKGKLDVVIATQQISASNIDYQKIGQETFCLVSSPNIELPKALKKPSVQQDNIEQFLLSQEWISYSSELSIIRRFWHVAFKQRPNIEPKVVVASLLSIKKAVELGWGVSVLPRYLCQQALNQGTLKILWQPQEAVVNDLWIATRKVDRNKPEIKQLVTTLSHKNLTLS